MPLHKGGKGGTKKYGRNKDFCKRYRDNDMRFKSKARRMRRILKGFKKNEDKTMPSWKDYYSKFFLNRKAA